MRRRLSIALVLLVALPLGGLLWLGSRASHDAALRVNEELQRAWATRLDDAEARVARLLDERRKQLAEATQLTAWDAASLRQRARSAPHVEQLFLRDPAGQLLYPAPKGTLTEAERAFLRRTRQLWTDADSMALPNEAGAAPLGEGWYVSYWENGLNLLYWRRLDDGRIVGAELSRVRLLADVIGVLPVTGAVESPLPNGRVRLLDARGAAVYQWGDYEPEEGSGAELERRLGDPLSAWRLQYFAEPSALSAAGRAGRLGLLAGLIALGLVLAGLAFFFARESGRALRDARQRVSFVNQVSHELKTPLTNIRMYAELLEREIDGEDERAQRHLGVIVSESQRLTRLIGNVLTFARQGRDTLALRPTNANLDRLVDELLRQFAPSLEQKGLTLTREAGAGDDVLLDTDLVSQIVGNLISNVEKYAPQGGLRVCTEQRGESSAVIVEDEGPGIPAAAADRVFRPFERLHNEVSEGVSGAGLGLALARDLARLHGGDLVVEPTARGTRMRLTLRTAKVRHDESPDR